MTQALVLRRDQPPEIPDDVDDPSVEKARGVATLPRWIDRSSEDPMYDLSDRWQRIRVYEQVLREGTVDDVRRFIDVDVLIDLWDELILPPAVSQAWIAWLARHRRVIVRDCGDQARERFHNSRAVWVVALSALQTRGGLGPATTA